VAMLRQLQQPLGASCAINASSVAWEGGLGKALGSSQPGPLTGWHQAGLFGTEPRGLSGYCLSVELCPLKTPIC
jgi:hypothetical protein